MRETEITTGELHRDQERVDCGRIEKEQQTEGIGDC